jgi:hypothetical protein
MPRGLRGPYRKRPKRPKVKPPKIPRQRKSGWEIFNTPKPVKDTTSPFLDKIVIY